MHTLPPLGQRLKKEHLRLLTALAKSCRQSIVHMVMNAQSGHPGGSCSVIDYLVLLYAGIVSQTGDDVVVSNGHVSPAVYSILAAMGYIPREDVIQNFRKAGSLYEGHVARHVPGVLYSTGPLGIGASVASGFAWAEKMKSSGKKVFAVLGDGECQEGQVYEMTHFASKYALRNLICFIDYNQVQLSNSLENVMPLNLQKTFAAAGWKTWVVDGHNFQQLWSVLGKAYASKVPTVIIGKTIMGKGVGFMEQEGRDKKATWHGVAPSVEIGAEALKNLQLYKEEETQIAQFLPHVRWTPPHNTPPADISVITEVDPGSPSILPGGTKSDCRSGYGKALLDLAQRNPAVVALSADLSGSVKTDALAKEFPERHLEVGIAEQHMLSCAGGLSLKGLIPFASTFGAFMTSRAKDQVRVNDINRTNVKMVATHCGLSVGEDGPTHQAIDDMGSMLGLFHIHVLEPADTNQTDHMIRFIASHYGNFYVRMGRHKFPVIAKKDGSAFYDAEYVFEYGKADLLRSGKDLTLIVAGSLVEPAVAVADELAGHLEIEVVAVSSLKRLDREVLVRSLQKTGRLITLEDHVPLSGLGSQVNNLVAQEGLRLDIRNMGVKEYQMSGTSEALYDLAGIGKKSIKEMCVAMTPGKIFAPAPALQY